MRIVAIAVSIATLTVLPGYLAAQEGFEFLIQHPEREGYGSLSVNDFGDILTYDLATGDISLKVSQDEHDYSNPLACFDFSTDDLSGPKLTLIDPNGHDVGKAIPLKLGIKYLFGSESKILTFSPANSVQCFYINLDGKLSLFGDENTSGGSAREMPAAPDDLIKYDRFAGYSNLVVTTDLYPPESADLLQVAEGKVLEYSVTVENVGKADATDVSIQELIQTSDGFGTGISAGTWVCEDELEGSESECPSGESSGPLRLEGIKIPIGAAIKITFSNRQVSGLEGATLQFHVVAVDGAGKGASYMTKSGSLEIVE